MEDSLHPNAFEEDIDEDHYYSENKVKIIGISDNEYQIA